MSTSPTATGSLARTPFPQLVVYIADRRLKGSLVLRSKGSDGGVVEHTVFLDDGAPVKARTGAPFAYLGEVLVDLGLLDEDGYRASLATLKTKGGLHGELLLRTGRIDRGGLMTGLREQVFRKMAYLFRLPKETTYAFFEGVNLLEDWGGPELTPIDPLRLVWSAVSAVSDMSTIDRPLSRLGKLPLRLRPDTDFARFGFQTGELAIINRIESESPSLEGLVASGAPEKLAKLVVYTLALSRYLDLGSPKQPPPLCADQPAELYRVVRMSRARTPSGQAAVARVKLQSRLMPVDGSPRAGAGASSQASEKPQGGPLGKGREEILQRAAAIDKEDYFTMLGLEQSATSEAIREAYFRLVKEWHPDRLSPALVDIRDASAKVFARIHEAYETLADTEQRQRYMGLLEHGGGTPEEAEQVQRILDAADDFQRARVFFKKQDIKQAEKLAERAMKGDPEQADYVALWASLQLQKRSAEENPNFADLLKLLDNALAKDENNERALLCRGNVLKRIGRIEAAMTDFRKLVELYPNNIDAAREIRLYGMRQKGGTSSSSASGERRAEGLLGKLFKR